MHGHDPSSRLDYVLAIRGQYLADHAHTERAAYTTFALYLTVAAALALGPMAGAELLGFLLVGAFALLLVFWQFDRRSLAAAIVEACDGVLGDGLQGDWPTDWAPVEVDGGHLLPRCLVQRLQDAIGRPRQWWRTPRPSEVAIVGAMFIMGILVARRAGLFTGPPVQMIAVAQLGFGAMVLAVPSWRVALAFCVILTAMLALVLAIPPV